MLEDIHFARERIAASDAALASGQITKPLRDEIVVHWKREIGASLSAMSADGWAFANMGFSDAV